ncbi:MAG: Type 1 glutamine amidotransferase-like domain-containing protein [Gemmatimonadaceae bacterium]|nr:Type 1 glutamine amidotransferase-like domain-containing protein [Gemmatimonadaceae bacterium]
MSTTGAANSPAINARVANADAVWIKGGDQGLFHDLWNGTQLETSMRAVIARGGAMGGTSAGAMSLAEYCLCGGMSLESKHVMQDARTPYLDDDSQPGTSGIHADFLGVISGVFIDSHVTERARLGRMLGVLARAHEDAGLDTLLGVGIESHSGLVIRNGIGEVRGAGSVNFVQQTPATVRRRVNGHPLVYTQLRVDRLTEGWRYDLPHRSPVLSALPPGVVPVIYPGPGASNQGALTIDGAR